MTVNLSVGDQDSTVFTFPAGEYTQLIMPANGTQVSFGMASSGFQIAVYSPQGSLLENRDVLDGGFITVPAASAIWIHPGVDVTSYIIVQ